MQNKIVLDSFSTINVLIGENGVGKSRLLNEIAEYKANNQSNVLIINNANCPNLNYKVRTKKHLKNKNSINKIKKIFVNFFNFNLDDERLLIDKEKSLNYLSNVLNYLSYDDVIFFKFYFKSKDMEYDLRHYEFFENLMWKYDDLSNFGYEDNKYIEFNLRNGFYDVNLNFFKFFRELGNLYFFDFDIFFRKRGNIVNLINLSSGEKSLFSNILFLLVNLDRYKKNVIIIDEPEANLHPKWQLDYLEKIRDLFYLFDPQIYLATHSPLLISELFFHKTEKIKQRYQIFHLDGQSIREINDENELSLEAIYWNVFGVLTPQSSFLSRQIVTLLNKLQNNKITIDYACVEIDKYIKASYDVEQITTLEDLKREILGIFG